MSLGTGIYSSGGGFGSFGSTNFGFDSFDLFKPTQTALVDAKTTATGKNDKNWTNVLDLILKYGGGVLTVLTTAGVIKNKNLNTVTSADYDQNALQALLDANGGNLDKAPDKITIPQKAGFALDFNNPVILLAIAAGGYLLLNKKK